MTGNSDRLRGFIHTKSIQWDSSWPELVDEADRRHIFSYMEGRFGIPTGFFDEYLLFKRGRNWWLIRNSPYLGSAAGFKVAAVGLRAFQRIGGFLKPTTRMIQIFGKMATRATFEIDEKELSRLMAGETVLTDLNLENGYLILSLKNHVLGLGLLINGEVRSQIPRKELKFLSPDAEDQKRSPPLPHLNPPLSP